MSDDNTIYYVGAGLAALMLLGAGYGVGRKAHRVGKAQLEHRKAATKYMNEVQRVLKTMARDEQLVAVRNSKIPGLSHGEVPLSEAKKNYYRQEIADIKKQLAILHGGPMGLSDRQIARLQALQSIDYAKLLPTIARQANIGETPRIEQAPQTPTTPATPATPAANEKGQFHQLKDEAHKRLGNWDAAIAELVAKHGGLLKDLKQKHGAWWARQVEKFKALGAV